MPAFATDGRRNSEGQPSQKSARRNQEDLVMELCRAVAAAQIGQDRETREHSGALKKTVLMPKGRHGFHKFVQEGVDAGISFAEEVRDRQEGEEVGSPHVRVALRTIHAMFLEPQLQAPAFQERMKLILQWWQDNTKNGNATEEEVAAAIATFKVRVPEQPTKTWRKKGIRNQAAMQEEEALEEGYARIEFCLENKEIQLVLVQIMVDLGGIRKTGPPPPSKPIRDVKELLAKTMRI